MRVTRMLLFTTCKYSSYEYVCTPGTLLKSSKNKVGIFLEHAPYVKIQEFNLKLLLDAKSPTCYPKN